MRDFVLKAESLFIKIKNYHGCEVCEQRIERKGLTLISKFANMTATKRRKGCF